MKQFNIGIHNIRDDYNVFVKSELDALFKEFNELWKEDIGTYKFQD